MTVYVGCDPQERHCVLSEKCKDPPKETLNCALSDGRSASLERDSRATIWNRSAVKTDNDDEMEAHPTQYSNDKSRRASHYLRHTEANYNSLRVAFSYPAAAPC
jgi:hypothetical protein